MSESPPPYKNVEITINDDEFVRAKATGSLLPDVSTWFKSYGQNQNIAPQNGNDIYFYTKNATHYGMGIFSSPAEYTYADLEGRDVHFEADIVFGAGASGHVVVNAYLRRNQVATSNESLFIRRIGLYDSPGHVTFDGTIGGEWFTSDYKDAYFGIVILCYSDKESSWSVDNIQFNVSSGESQSEVLQAKCLWGDSNIARQILDSLNGFTYRPFEATGARLDPAAEIGDNVVINGDVLVLYSQSASFDSEFVSGLSAPFEQEIDHEFPYVPSTERRFKREIRTLRAEIDIQADAIEAKVSQVSGSQNSFGWRMESDNFTVYASGSEVLKVTRQGASISGHVVATSGTIGGCEIRDGRLIVRTAQIEDLYADRIIYGTINSQGIPQVIQTQIGDESISTIKTDGVIQGHFQSVMNNVASLAGLANDMRNTFTVNALSVGGGLTVRYMGTTRVFQPINKSNASMVLGFR